MAKNLLSDPSSQKKYYWIGFWTSFLTFSLQIFLPQIYSFYHFGAAVIEIFPYFLLGFGTGVAISLSKRKGLFKLFFSLIPFFLLVTCVLFTQFTDSLIHKIVFTGIFIPLGCVLSIGFRKFHCHTFYSIDLLGGLFGVTLSLLSILFISIESSLLLLIMMTALISIVLRASQGKKILLNIGILLITAIFLFYNIKNQSFNLMYISRNIKEPIDYSKDNIKNGFTLLKKGHHRLISTKWSFTERVDIIENIATLKKNVYFNNKRWSSVINGNNIYYKSVLPLVEPFNSILVVGPAGGNLLHAARNIGKTDITGIELNHAVFSLMRNELSEITNNLYIDTNVILGEARRFISNSTKNFDIISLFDVNYRGETFRNALSKDYIRTHQGISEILDHLTADGKVIWSISYVDTVFQEDLFFIISATHKYLEQAGNKFLSKHYFLTAKKRRERRYSAPIKRANFIVKKTEFTDSEVKNIVNYCENNNIEIIYNPLSKTNLAKESLLKKERMIIEALSSNSFAGLLVTLNKKFALNVRPISDDLPFLYIGTQQRTLFKTGIILLIFALFLVIFFILHTRNYLAQSIGKVFIQNHGLNYWTLLAWSFVYGFFYGYIEILLLNQFESAFKVPILSTGFVLLSLLLGGAIGGHLGSTLSLKTILVTQTYTLTVHCTHNRHSQ